MAQKKSVNFLPQVFRSDTNQRFFGATVDHLINDSVNRPVSGYIGRRVSPTYKLGDNYVPELNSERQNYQLEPSAVVVDDNKNIIFNAGYTDIIKSVTNNFGPTNNHHRLFTSEYYNYDGKFDYDKFINYNDYYWLPNGPDAVGVTSGSTPYQATFKVTRDTAVGGYTFSTLGGHPNTQITLARGGTYNFIVDQPGFKFWIQTKPGTAGLDPNLTNLTTRNVFGAVNNGTDVGTVTFNVPQSNAQDFYTQMPLAGSADAAVTFDYTKIQNRLLSEFILEFPGGLDGLTSLLNRKTFIFVGGQVDDSNWVTPDLPAGAVTGLTSIAPGSVIADPSRTAIWQISLVPQEFGDSLIQIQPATPVVTQQRVFVKSGKTFANQQYWLNNIYRFTLIPPITADAEYLYYQDESNPLFTGQIKLVNNKTAPINITNDILGRVGYTSPNGVIFTNGLKVTFDNLVTPGTYANKSYYVDGVGQSITLIAVDSLIVPTHLSALIQTEADYITINRGSQDGNSWSSTNRWFHKDVLSAVANYNSTSTINYGPNIQGRRPIIEFEPNFQLWQYGRQAKASVDLFIKEPTDAFVDIEGQVSYTITETKDHGGTVSTVLKPGMRIIFSNDYDINVKNNIWQVTIENINSRSYIRLSQTADDPVVDGETIFVSAGAHAGYMFSFNGTTDTWSQCQYKSRFNQAPLFDLVDAVGYSFGDATMYPGSNFAGTQFFGYATGAGTTDKVLGFPLKYKNFNNIGDIVFNNYYDTDSFTYTENQTDNTVAYSTGYLKKNLGLTNSSLHNNWVTGVEQSLQYQAQTKFFDGRVITDNQVEYAFVRIDITPDAQKTIPYCKVLLNNVLLTPGTDYKLTKYGAYDIVLFTNNTDSTLKINIGDKIDILIYSENSISALGYYEIPTNLDYNPLNENFETITLGQLRSHYNKLIENTSTNNRPLRDSYLKAQGGTLLQQSSPLLYALTFMNDPKVNFFDSIDLARKEYSKFKNKFLNLCETLTTLDYQNPVAGVDTILQNINAIKNQSFPWYYSDMVPQGDSYSTVVYTVNNTRQTNYEISSIFDNTQLSSRAVIVYLNNQQLVVDQDYTFSKISPAIVFNSSMSLAIGDIITIRDYSSTDGNYIPETPTKLGLFPKYVPEIYTDTTYQIPALVIRGHDGSITPAFGDFRDAYLLELEKRIYNNIKSDYFNKNMIDIYDVLPGRFRKTDYSLTDVGALVSKNFLQWAGSNNLDFADNSYYQADNPWTWNYALGFPDVIDGTPLNGSWRAVYEYWFDTDTPNLSPWEMLGFPSEPTWWKARYGSAPYTSGNTLLWEDLEAGYVWNNGNSYTDSRFTRPGLTKFIPVDTAGNLLMPTAIPLTTKASSQNASAKFFVGHHGPVETAWRRSSEFPYAIQIALALAKPAQYFGTQLDISRFYTNPVTGHVSDLNNKKISPGLLAVNGDSTGSTVKRTSGYINWIADNIKNVGVDPVAELNRYFKNLSVQLAYKVAGFTDQKLITVTAEQTSPGSTNASVIIPDENYHVYLNKSVPAGSLHYSAVIVQRTENGYVVTGYDTTNPYFPVIPSIANGKKETVRVLDVDISFYEDSRKQYVMIPYGTTFTNHNQVVDFLISYERHLRLQGFQFEDYDQDLQRQRDFRLSAEEFAYWAQQGFTAGSLIVLNPCATRLSVNSGYSVVDEITNLPGKSRLLDQNFNPIKNNTFNVVRTNVNPATNNTQVTTLNSASICFAKFNLIQFEHVLVFDNVDDFGDIIYLPKLGNRQFRLGIKGSVTGQWDGSMTSPGYIYSNPIIDKWQQGTDYKLGDVVEFNSGYYTAANDISASETFGTGSWIQIDRNNIQTGMLPSFGTNAGIFDQIYDIDNPPSDENLQKFSAGLLGFRERSYLTDLGLSISNQTKFYQGYIKQKGTINSIDALTRATFNNINGSINTYEEWAFLSGQYGDLDNNKFVEFVLDQSVFNTNPVALQTSNTYDAGNIVVKLAVTGNTTTSNVYNSSDLTSTSTTIYDNRVINDQYIHDLPYAGFVNVNDIDSTIFDIATHSQEIDLPATSKVWVAKDADKNWNVFRVSQTDLTATKLTYTLDNYVRVDFNNPHGFNKGDYLVIKRFDTHWDGMYQVVGIPNALSITVQIRDKQKLGYLISVSPVTGAGLIYKLVSFVVDQVTDIESIRPLYNWQANEKVWVRNASQLGWGVYSFNRPWHANTVQQRYPSNPGTNGYFGTATVTSEDNKWIYAGAPGTRSVQLFGNVNHAYTAGNVVTSSDSGFGTSLATTGNIFAVSAPDAGNVHVYTNINGTLTHVQNIVSGNTAEFGSSIDLSADGHWLYITEPGKKQIHAYTTANVTAGNIHYTHVGVLTGNSSIVKTNTTGNIVFVGAPVDTNVYAQNGNVYVYSRTANSFAQFGSTLSSQHKNPNAAFGTSLDIDHAAGNVFIGVPNSTVGAYANGVVERWVLNSAGNAYVYNETIIHPNQAAGTFGISIGVSSDGQLLAVGSGGSTGEEDTTFDNEATVIDASTTKFIDLIRNSGSVYTFEPLYNYGLAHDFGRYNYIQQLSSQLHDGDEFGTSVVVSRDLLVVGAPGVENGAVKNAGEIHVYTNPSQSKAWTLLRQQQPRVDIDSINRTFIYNKNNNNILAALDFVDPNKGKVLNSIAADIDYQRTADPAVYNAGSKNVLADYHWGPAQVGKIWWNLDSIRYIDYEQDDLTYRLNHWGQMFPGSQVEVYEWVESTVLPSQYTGDGTAVYADNSAYSTSGYVDVTGAVKIKYYFWVVNKTSINELAGKRNSVYSIANAIEHPQSQNIPYAAVLQDNAVGLFNVSTLLSGKSSVLHITSRSTNAGLIHSEYALVQEGNPNTKIPTNINTKFVDSLAGIDAVGNTVPDPALTPAQAYGISVRPRQSMFVNRFNAVTNYIELINSKLSNYPVSRRKVLTLLNSSETAPNINSGAYAQVVSDDIELTYVDTTGLSTGYHVLVQSDAMNQGRWAIYTWSGTAWAVSRVQSYKTNLYWLHTNWYDSTYDPTQTPDVTVATTLELGKLTLTANTYVKVLDAGLGKFEVYYIDSSLNKTLVGIEGGTIQISTGTIPGKELRQILVAMKDEIFIDDLASDYNQIFFALIKYALVEQKNPDWVFKTSFLTATQYLRKLEQFPSYIADNQNFYRDYINEVKPYRTVLREFVVNYQKNDQYGGDITDFDLPPYWDATQQVYRSPSGELNYDTSLLTAGKYQNWANSYKYKLVSIQVDKPGSGYLTPPQIIITDDGGHGATAYSTIDANGGVAEIIITNPGADFVTTPKIIINGSGKGAIASPVLRNIYNNGSGYNVIRSIGTTLKFDRINYTNSNTFIFWDTLTSADAGKQVPANTIIRTDDVIYKLFINDWTANTVQTVSSLVYAAGNTYITTGNTYGAVFTNPTVQSNVQLVTQNARSYTINANLTIPIFNITNVTAKDFDNANDRIVAFNGNVDFGNTTDGIDYPGVIIDGNTFTGSYYDSIIQSKFTDSLGVNPSDINIDGGAFISTFSSHAPQELVPGRMYDSLNLSVFDQDALSFRIFKDMNLSNDYYRIANQNSARLTRDLLLTDKYIHLDDATKLPTPNLYLNIPGVIFVNGEKITYWRNYANEIPKAWTANLIVAVDTLISESGNTYITTGNVFGTNFAANSIQANISLITDLNVLTRIRRATNGTSPQAVHSAGSWAVDASQNQLIPIVKPTYTTITSDTSYKVTDVNSITLGLQLTSPINANIGDVLTQQLVVDTWQNAIYSSGEYVYWEGNTYITNGNTMVPVVAWQSNTVYPTGTYVTQAGNTYVSTGNIWAQNKSWTANTAFPTGSNIYIGSNSYYTTTGNVYVTIPTWTGNTAFAANTSIYHNGNVYRVTGNTYAPNVTWYPGINLPVGSYMYYAGASYVTLGNVGYKKVANVTTMITNFSDLTWRIKQVDTTQDSGFAAVQYAGNVVNTGSILQFGNISANVQFLYAGINAGFNSIKSNVQYLPTGNIAWQPNTDYTVNSYISNNGNIYIVHGNVNSPTFASISSNVSYSSPLLTPSESQFTKLVNSGAMIPSFVGNTITSVTLKVMDNVSNVTVVPVIISLGSITNLPEIFDGTGFDVESFDNVPGALYINGTPVYSFVKTASVLGTVTLAGTANISLGANVKTEPLWYNRGLSTAADGYGIINSATPAALFLQDSRGFTPDSPGNTTEFML